MSRGRDGRRVHRVEDPLPLRPAMIGKVDSNAAGLHRRRREQARRQELRGRARRRAPRRGPTGRRSRRARRPSRVRNRTGFRNDAEERRPERPPVLQRPVLEDATGGRASDAPSASSALTRSASGRSAAGRRPRGVDRRTRTVSGRSPRSWAAATTPRRRRRRAGRRSGSFSIRSARPSSWPSSVSWTPAGKRSSVDLPRRVALDQLARRALGDDLRLVHDDEPVAELLGLVHVVRREDEGHAALLEPVQPVPEEVARLRVEARRRLVEEQQVRLVDQRPRDRQAPLHAARQRLHLVLRALGELDELEQLVGAAARTPPAEMPK